MPTFPDYFPDVHRADSYSDSLDNKIRYEDPPWLFLTQQRLENHKHTEAGRSGEKQTLFILESMSLVLYLAEPALILPGDKARRVRV